MGEMTLSGVEDLGEGGDDLLDLRDMIGNKVDLLPTGHHLARHRSFHIIADHPASAVMQICVGPMMTAYLQAPSTTSTGGAAVASSFNFTKAAKMRAAAMQRQSIASSASAPMQAVQLGIEPGMVLPGKLAEAEARSPAPPMPSKSGPALLLVTPTSSQRGATSTAGPLPVGNGAAAGVQPLLA